MTMKVVLILRKKSSFVQTLVIIHLDFLHCHRHPEASTIAPAVQCSSMRVRTRALIQLATSIRFRLVKVPFGVFANFFNKS